MDEVMMIAFRILVLPSILGWKGLQVSHFDRERHGAIQLGLRLED